MPPSPWQPTASPDMLIARAAVLRQIRSFFEARGVVEVETPLLSHGTITDPHIQSIPVTIGSETVYLQTSPEYAMKRLLCAGMPDIFQLCKAFRQDDPARCHNPEFSMLEWYRLGYSLEQLMDEVSDLFMSILSCPAATRIPYQAIFESLGFDPFTVTQSQCRKIAKERGLEVSDSVASLSKDSWLQLLFSTFIEPTLGFDAPVFVYDFPASQASLARLHPDNPQKAMRVEVFINGMELGNGFDELENPDLQAQRFEEDNQMRSELGLGPKPIDTRLLDALRQGLPQCSGIAIGIDRLVMCALKQADIKEILAFNWLRA